MVGDDRASALIEFVEGQREALIEFTRELVRRATTLGSEEIGQVLVAETLDKLGFETQRVEPDGVAAAADRYAGYPALDYAGRSSVVGHLPGAQSMRSVHLSGHVDVVPVDSDDDWTHDPWGAEVAEGRIWGRGAGDMKGGLAAYLFAAAAIASVYEPGERGELIFSSVFEEEFGGNGMWSVVRAGHEADDTFIGEPTGLMMAYASTGVVWARLIARGGSGHSMVGGRRGPFEELGAAMEAIRKFETTINSPVKDPVFAAASEWPYGVTVGRLQGGIWTSSMPAKLVASIRVGFGRTHEPEEVQEEIREFVRVAAPSVEVEFEAFRARAWAVDPEGPLAACLSAAHRRVLSTETRPIAFTGATDARFVSGPCLCYGPSGGNFHGADEWVDLESLVKCAAVIACASARALTTSR